MIVEAPDIESWGKSDQMLITSFYAFENLSADGLTFFFDKADELGIGAIVFKPERLLAEAPAQIVKLCDKHDLPLIQIPADTKYEGLLLDVLGNFLDSNLTLLNRFFFPVCACASAGILGAYAGRGREQRRRDVVDARRS